MLYHIKQSIVPNKFCDEVIKQGEEKDISKGKNTRRQSLQIEPQMYLG